MRRQTASAELYLTVEASDGQEDGTLNKHFSKFSQITLEDIINCFFVGSDASNGRVRDVGREYNVIRDIFFNNYVYRIEEHYYTIITIVYYC